MPIIYTYPTITPTSEDLLLISDTSSSNKITKSATVSSILELGVATSKVTLSAAEVQALHITPIELITAPGTNKLIQVLNIMGYIDYNSIAYNKVNMQAMYTGASTYFSHWQTSFINANADRVEYAQWGAIGSGPLASINTAIQATNSGSAGAGDSPITIYTTYKIIDV